MLLPGLDGDVHHRLNGRQQGAHKGCGTLLHSQPLLAGGAVRGSVGAQPVSLQGLHMVEEKLGMQVDSCSAECSWGLWLEQSSRSKDVRLANC